MPQNGPKLRFHGFKSRELSILDHFGDQKYGNMPIFAKMPIFPIMGSTRYGTISTEVTLFCLSLRYSRTRDQISHDLWSHDFDIMIEHVSQISCIVFAHS